MPENKLNIGCGQEDLEGYTAVDIVDTEAADVVHDLNETPYPFEDDQFKHIRANHVIEHLDDLLAVMEEIYRISEPGATVDIRVPYFTSVAAYNDPTHNHFFAYNSFHYFTGENGYDFYTQARFEYIDRKIKLGSYPLKSIIERFVNKFPKFYEHTFLRSIFPTANLNVELEVVK